VALATVVVASASIAVGTITLAASSGEAANINQCRNGAFDAHVRCIGSAFQNGNLGATNSHYREGDNVPFQALLTGLTTGSHTLDIQWDETASGKHAYDYIGTYTRTESNADACSGVLTTAQCGVHTTATVLGDPTLGSPCAFTSTYSATQIAGVIDIYGATGAASMAYVGTQASCQGSALTRTARVTFSTTSGQASVVVAWGGHVASQLDWGLGNSASQISGSPYHMRLVALDSIGLGNQDRSIKAAAILPVPSIATSADGASSNVPQISPGTSFTDTATLTGDSTHGDVTGFVNFYMCGPTTSVQACSTGTLVGTAPANVTLVPQATNPPTSTATSASVAPTGVGFYCFRVLYTPDATAGYSPGQSTSTTNECVEVVSRGTTNASAPQSSDAADGTFTDATSAVIGSWIRDKDVVSATSQPVGTIAFHVCGPTATAVACTSAAATYTAVSEDAAAKTTTSTSVTFYSVAFQPTTAGYYCFAADFDGTPPYQDSNDNATTECIHILPASPALSTTPSATTTWSATLSDSAQVGPGNNPGGSVRFRLYDSLAACNGGSATVGTDGLIYEETVSFTANGTNTRTVSTTGAGSGSNVVSTAGTYEWLAHYSGDTNNDPNDSACGDEAETITAATHSP
jgi:hypothetical protein